MTLFRRLFLPNKTRDSDPSDNWRIIERWAADNYDWAIDAPRGCVAHAEVTTNQGPIVGAEIAVSGLTLTYRPDSDRLMMLRANLFPSDSNANEHIGIFLRSNAALIGRGEFDTSVVATFGFSTIAETSPFKATSGTAYTFTVGVQRLSGAGNITINGTVNTSSLQLIDLGSA